MPNGWHQPRYPSIAQRRRLHADVRLRISEISYVVPRVFTRFAQARLRLGRRRVWLHHHVISTTMPARVRDGASREKRRTSVRVDEVSRNVFVRKMINGSLGEWGQHSPLVPLDLVTEFSHPVGQVRKLRLVRTLHAFFLKPGQQLLLIVNGH